jgi:hypothetical protein
VLIVSSMNIKNVRHLIDRLGGSLKVAVLTNNHQLTVDRWKSRNRIPKKYHEILSQQLKQKAGE